MDRRGFVVASATLTAGFVLGHGIGYLPQSTPSLGGRFLFAGRFGHQLERRWYDQRRAETCGTTGQQRTNQFGFRNSTPRVDPLSALRSSTRKIRFMERDGNCL